jgi:type I restriction enzyme R subunit
MSSPSEKRFEFHIEQSLNDKGYKSIPYTEYDKTLCLIPDEFISFIKNSQPKEYEKLVLQYGFETEVKLCKRLTEEIGRRGVIDVLRNGFKDRGCNFSVVYFEPNSGLNPEHSNLYKRNCFEVVRQLRYSTKNENSIDMVLFLNGIPLITMELKNQLTSQNYKNSELQYRQDRDPKELLFQFKRMLSHFCVDNDHVTMTTQLKGDDTKFLPYNKSIENPFNPDGYKTHYLWEEILTTDSLLDIIENFVHVSKESEKVWDSYKGKVVEKTKDVLIFPRYHQLDCVRKIREKVKEEGTGHNYLIQHTTGSGKSYEIGWLSHLLTSLYRTKENTNRIFDTIIVVTDRKVLDKQLQNTITQLQQTIGVVNNVTQGSKQLKEFLEQSKDIIISTIQKFPVISESISELKSRTFGIIVDEVHSSQSGEGSKHLRKSISKGTSETDEEDEDDTFDYEDLIREEIRNRGHQNHISYFGFTGTPKNKTLELFGRKNEEGHFVPFHSYTMKQSIYEGFTLDVLKNYTTYSRWFKLTQTGEDKPVPEGKVIKQVMDFVDSHPDTIEQKVKIILHQFINKTSKTITGKGRGMVVVRSRYHCVLFQQEMKKQMKQMGLPSSVLVGYSGTIKYGGRDLTEGILNKENGLQNLVSIPDGLKDPRYRILIVSSKFQTGFDEPLLQSMFVDKKLSGVQCVQTLSRLNRTCSGKTETFVLDFVNETEDVVESFQPYYTTTELIGETDPNKLYDLETKIKGFNLFTKFMVDEFCKLFYNEHETDEILQPILNRVVEKWKEIQNPEQRDEFKSLIQSYIRLYGYISQIITFEDIELEKLFIFLKYVNKKLPKGEQTKVDISDSIDLDSLRIQKIGEFRLSLIDKSGELEPPSSESGVSRVDEPLDLLSEIIRKMNEIYGVEITEENRLDLQNVHRRVMEDESLRKVMTGDNSETNKKRKFEEVLGQIILSYVNNRVEFYQKMENPQVKRVITDDFFRDYQRSYI